MKPRLLDLFCKAGGCTRGYQMAGFHVTGVDVEKQPHYIGEEFVQSDALDYLAAHGREFDAIHASPPCQAYSKLTKRWTDRPETHTDLVAYTRDLLMGYAVPWVIENVPGAPLGSFMLCGSMFGLKVRRHRWFECSDVILVPSCRHKESGLVVQVNGSTGGSSRRDAHLPRHTVAHWATAMGIDWMTQKELSQAIPPAYTKYIGDQLMRIIANEYA